jgi:uncharacterized protein
MDALAWPAELTPLQWAVGLSAALLAGFSKTGLPGVGMLVVAALAVVFPARQSVGTLLPLLILGDLFAVARYRRHARVATLLRLLPFVLLGMVPGNLFLNHMPERPFALSLGVLILLLVALEMMRRRGRWDHVPRSMLFTAAIGILAGFATTIGNVAGPIMSVYLLSMGMDKHAFLGTGAWYYLTVNLLKVPIFLSQDMISAETFRFDLWAAPFVALGCIAGMMFLPRIPQKVFSGVIFALAALAALSLILSSL